MKYKDILLLCLTLIFITSSVLLFADPTPSCIVDPEFANTQLIQAPLAVWESAGSNAAIETMFIINLKTLGISYFYNPCTSLQRAKHSPNADTKCLDS